MGTIAENLIALNEAKANIKTAIESKGQDMANVPFTQYHEKISAIQTGGNESETEIYLKGVLDGTLEEFDNTKLNMTSLAGYRFNEFKNLKSANFKGILQIPNYVCASCISLADLILDESTTSIGDYAFKSCQFSDFILNMNNPCEIGIQAFWSSRVSAIRGQLGSIGNDAFRGMAQYLTNIDVKIQGTIGNYAFNTAWKIDNFNINKESVIRGTLGEYCFGGVGASRANPENNIFYLDFSNSTFHTLGTYAFGGSNSTYNNRYYSIKFPTTLSTINSYAFRYGDNMTLYFKSSVPASLNSSAFNNTTNLRICVNYSYLNTYKTATNWVTHSEKIRGFVDANVFTLGKELPRYSPEGYSLLWYKDVDLTEPVSVVEDIDAIYYCKLGEEQVETIGINSIYADNCIVTISDSTGHTYGVGEGVKVGTQLTIKVEPTIVGYIPYVQTFNNENFTSEYTYTAISDIPIDILCLYYNGVDVPANSDLNQNSWAVIKSVVQKGDASKIWTVGQVKEIDIGGFVYQIRLSDLQTGRYNYAEGTKTTNAVFEFVQLLANQAMRINATNTNLGGWASSELRTKLNTTILEQLPVELKNILEEVMVASADGGSTNYTGITTSSNKLFIPCAEEINSSADSYEGEGTTWDYYIDSPDSKRIKTRVNNTDSSLWWNRSPIKSLTTNFWGISNNGDRSGSGATSSLSICPCFAW